MVPKDRVLVAESGLGAPADLARMARVGASAFLIGESFMRQPDVDGGGARDAGAASAGMKAQDDGSPISTSRAMPAWSMSATRT